MAAPRARRMSLPEAKLAEELSKLFALLGIRGRARAGCPGPFPLEAPAAFGPTRG